MFKQTPKTDKPGRYMEELDAWIEVFILRPLNSAWCGRSQSAETGDLMVSTVRRNVKDKVLESYRNGRLAAQNSAPRGFYPRRRN